VFVTNYLNTWTDSIFLQSKQDERGLNKLFVRMLLGWVKLLF